MKREGEGQLPLTSLPEPCDYLDIIGGTSTGGEFLLYPIIIILETACLFI